VNAFAQLGLIAFISLTAASLNFRLVGPPERGVACDPSKLREDEICLADVLSRTDETILWIDARPRADWQADGLEGSVLWNLDPNEDEAKMEETVMTHLVDSTFAVVYCGEGNCGTSREIAARVRRLGVVDQVYALHGGIAALRAAGLVGEVKDSN
jgi:rhodanese-related sulfurtransferase